MKHYFEAYNGLNQGGQNQDRIWAKSDLNKD